MANKKKQRAGVSKKDGKAVLIYFPASLVESLDKIVIKQDTDRSKFIRNAVRKAMSRS